MHRMKNIALVALCVTLGSSSLFAQKKGMGQVGPNNQQGTTVLRDFSYPNRVLPFVEVSEDDIYWFKEYITAIDLKQPSNQPLYFPIFPTRDRKNMTMVMMEAVMKDKTVQPYEDPYFESPLEVGKVEKMLFRIEKNVIEDFETGAEKEVIDTIRIRETQIIEYLVREERYFDKKRSVMESRIVAICPVALVQNRETYQFEKQQLFWLYFPDLRPILANSNVWNEGNSWQRMTYDEFFLKRLYTAEIKKVSNLQDRFVYDYNKSKRDQHLEAERIKEEYRNFEHDLWSY